MCKNSSRNSRDTRIEGDEVSNLIYPLCRFCKARFNSVMAISCPSSHSLILYMGVFVANDSFMFGFKFGNLFSNFPNYFEK